MALINWKQRSEVGDYKQPACDRLIVEVQRGEFLTRPGMNGIPRLGLDCFHSSRDSTALKDELIENWGPG